MTATAIPINSKERTFASDNGAVHEHIAWTGARPNNQQAAEGQIDITITSLRYLDAVDSRGGFSSRSMKKVIASPPSSGCQFTRYPHSIPQRPLRYASRPPAATSGQVDALPRLHGLKEGIPERHIRNQSREDRGDCDERVDYDCDGAIARELDRPHGYRKRRWSHFDKIPPQCIDIHPSARIDILTHGLRNTDCDLNSRA